MKQRGRPMAALRAVAKRLGRAHHIAITHRQALVRTFGPTHS